MIVKRKLNNNQINDDNIDYSKIRSSIEAPIYASISAPFCKICKFSNYKKYVEGETTAKDGFLCEAINGPMPKKYVFSDELECPNFKWDKDSYANKWFTIIEE